MFVLLSSDSAPRYKQDILRCLAAPKDALVQFRYAKIHVAQSVLDALAKKTFKFPLSGIVCSVASVGMGPLLTVPVREVEITRPPNEHGTTISVLLRMKDVVVAEPKTFTTQLFTLSGQTSPRKIESQNEPMGKYFFEIVGKLDSLKSGDTLEQWEECVEALRLQLAFKDEPFFWTVLGLGRRDKQIETTKLLPWPDQVGPFESLDLLIYHYQPKTGPKPDSKLEVFTGNMLTSDAPPDVTIDSRYDLKHWMFQSRSKGYRTRHAWIRVRTADTWNLDLSLKVKGTWLLSGIKGLAAGLLIAAPSVIAILSQSPSPPHLQFLIGGSILAAVLAGLIAIFHGERLD